MLTPIKVLTYLLQKRYTGYSTFFMFHFVQMCNFRWSPDSESNPHLSHLKDFPLEIVLDVFGPFSDSSLHTSTGHCILEQVQTDYILKLFVK